MLGVETSAVIMRSNIAISNSLPNRSVLWSIEDDTFIADAAGAKGSSEKPVAIMETGRRDGTRSVAGIGEVKGSKVLKSKSSEPVVVGDNVIRQRSSSSFWSAATIMRC